MIYIDMQFWDDVIIHNNIDCQASFVNENIQTFLKETLCNDAICNFVSYGLWAISLPPKYETLFRIKYSDYIV